MDILKFKKSVTPKMMMVFMFVLFSFLLVACNSTPKVKATVTGTIETVNENGAMSVNIEEATGTKLGGTVRLGIPEGTDETFNVGDKVKIGFDGSFFESEPAYIQAITLEKIE